MNENEPENFNLDNWLLDAKRPERSVEVYKRADLIGALDDLERRIELEDRIAGVEAALGESSELVDEYEAVAKAFTDSALTVYVQAVIAEEEDAIKEVSDAAKESNQEKAYRLIAASIIGVQSPGSARRPATLTLDQVRALAGALGEGQTATIANAMRLASSRVPAVNTDFLSKRFSPANGQES